MYNFLTVFLFLYISYSQWQTDVRLTLIAASEVKIEALRQTGTIYMLSGRITATEMPKFITSAQPTAGIRGAWTQDFLQCLLIPDRHQLQFTNPLYMYSGAIKETQIPIFITDVQQIMELPGKQK